MSATFVYLIDHLIFGFRLGHCNITITYDMLKVLINVGIVVWLVILYDLVSCVSPTSQTMMKLFYAMGIVGFGVLRIISLIAIIFSKSAQLPFFSRSLNATPAPTPISALLHSSTMVIAGVYLGPIIDDQLVLLLDISCFFSLAYSISLSITLIFSLLSAISVSDVKSIIASPTVSQLSYMFLALVINPILSLLIY